MPTTTANASTVTVRSPDKPKNDAPLRVTSSSFTEGGDIPLDFVFTGCGGKNKSPQLAWSGAPEGTKSYAITCFDPDAPTGSGFWHWVAFDIPGNVTSIDSSDGKDAPKGGKSATSDYGMTGYGGPCPPKGDGKHRYIFTVYALDVDKVDGAGDKAHGATLIFMMRGHVLATGKLEAKFGH
ncbi:MAG TPA: YbhB/YbcL family Raf kinase inhibitor-like protein [Gemmatimonadaceae bacterium]|nr:YbhB/YbcL family Raf kinase inhibitor-like protein [Gemmatimonadaceae bacterium]